MDNPFERALKHLEPATKPTEEVKESALIPNGKNEIMNIFGLTRELFEYAAQNLSEEAGFRYADSNNEFDDNSYAKELPQNFYPIIADYPGKYFVVSYENRMTDYYKKGTRMKHVGLSSVSKRSETNEKIREIGITEYAPSEGKRNVQFLTVTDSVMEKGFANINTAGEGELDSPHGSAKLTYEVNPIGEKKVINSKFDRMDEGMFEWSNEQTPVRWVRNLEIDKQGRDDMEVSYRDLYIIGRHHQSEGHKDIRVQVNIEAKGKLSNPVSIEISFGYMGTKGKALFEDSESNIKVIMGDTGRTTPEDIESILRNDPNYAFIFEGSVDKEKVIELIKQKADMISNDWDKKSAVFGSNALRGSDVMPELGYI